MPAAMKIGDGDKKEAPDRRFLFDVIAATSPDAGALRIARPPSLRCLLEAEQAAPSSPWGSC
jgi:hypothetical protein